MKISTKYVIDMKTKLIFFILLDIAIGFIVTSHLPEIQQFILNKSVEWKYKNAELPKGCYYMVDKNGDMITVNNTRLIECP